jgi:hypothetical protein
MKPVTKIRIFGAVSSALSVPCLFISFTAFRFLSTDFFVARFYMVLLSFLLFAFTVWILAASFLLICGRKSSWTVLLVNGVVCFVFCGTLASLGLREQSRHDAGFFAAVVMCIILTLFGLVQGIAALRPSIKSFGRIEGKSAIRSIKKSVVLSAVLLSVIAPASVFIIHSVGELRPCFVSKVTASSQAPAHPAVSVCGAKLSMFWSPASSKSEGEWVKIEFPFIQKVEAVDIRGGASFDDALRKKMHRIKSGTIQLSNGDMIPFSLSDKGYVQRVAVPAADCKWVIVTVTSVYEGENGVLGVGIVSPQHRVEIFR